MNVWVPKMGDNAAQYGNEKHLYLLARVLERRIIVLHGPLMSWLRNKRNANAKDINKRTARHSLFTPDSKHLRPTIINEIRVLKELESYDDTLVIEHDGGAHYKSLIRRQHSSAEKIPNRPDLPASLAKEIAETSKPS